MGVFCARSADTPARFSWAAGASTRSYFTTVRIAGVLAFGLAVLILLGWAGDITMLKSGLSGQRATQPLTAVCFAVCGICLGLSTESCVLCRVLQRAGAILVLIVVGATVWQNALDTDWGLDRFLFSDSIVHEQPGEYLRPGRPAGGTLIGFTLLCLCLLLTEARSAAARSLYMWFATVGALLAATLLLAYAFSLDSLYAMGFYAHVGLNSSIELAVLFYGVLLRRADLGWMHVLAGGSVGAVSARRILLWTGSLLVILAVIVRVGTGAALYGARFEVTLLTVGSLGVLLAALLAHARRLNALEAIRNNVASDLQAVETELLRASHSKDELLAALAHELRNPLTPLRNGIEIVRQMSSSNPALARTVDMMARQITHLVRLVDDVVGKQFGAQEAQGTTEPQPHESRQLRILIADDNADGAASLAMLLQGEGHVVLTASDGRIAVDLAELFHPDVILMDVAMPHVDGLEATRQIRARSWGVDVRIVALTAWGQEAERRRTREAGMDFHLVKPVDPQALAGVLAAGRPPFGSQR
jgi:CheY-like chemotaxis protein